MKLGFRHFSKVPGRAAIMEGEYYMAFFTDAPAYVLSDEPADGHTSGWDWLPKNWIVV